MAKGPEWEHICELGQELDAGNPLYRPGGQPAEGAAAAAPPATAASASTAATQADAGGRRTGPVDLDLDLDFSLGDDEPDAAARPTRGTAHPAAELPPAAEPMPALDMDFGAAAVTAAPVRWPPRRCPWTCPRQRGKPSPSRPPLPDLELPDNGLTFTTEPAAAPRARRLRRRAAAASAPTPA